MINLGYLILNIIITTFNLIKNIKLLFKESLIMYINLVNIKL